MWENSNKPGDTAGSDLVIPSLLLFAVSLLLYWNTLDNGFVIDDVDVVAENTQIRSLDGALRLLTTGYWERVGFVPGDLLYRPVTMLSFALEYAVWGLNARWFHATNMVLNGCVVVLVFLLVACLFGNRPLALVTAVLYAFLPCHVEAVAPVVGRSELLSAFFGFLGWLFYLRGSTRSFAVSLVCLGLAIAAKENAVVFPVLILAADIVRLRRHTAAHTPPDKLGAGSESVACGSESGVRSLESGVWSSEPAPAGPRCAAGDSKSALPFSFTGGTPVPPGIGEMLRRLAASCAVVCFYLAARYIVLERLTIDPTVSYFRGRPWLVVWLSMGKYFFSLYFRWLFLGTGMNPACLRPCYGDAATDDILAWCLLGVLIVLAISTLWAFVRNPSIPVYGVLFFMVGMAPVSNFFVRIAALAGVRFLYIPSMGICLAAACYLLKAIAPPDRSRRVARAVVLCLLGLLLAVYTWLIVTGNKRFHDEESAYRSILEIAPRSHFAMHNLGATLAKERRYDEALPILEYIKKQAPELDRVHYNLGLIYMEEGRLDEAEESLRTAIALDTGVGMVSDMHVALGNILEKKGDLRGARNEFMYAVATRYNNAKAHNNLANSYYREGKYAAAERHYRIALEENPDMAEPWQGLGTVLVAQKRYHEAISEVYDRALKNPQWQAWAFAGIGRCLMGLGNRTLAEEALRRALELERNNLDSLVNLSALYLDTGRFEESIVIGEHALQAGGTTCPEVLHNLALAYEKIGRREAIVLWKRFLELAEGNPRFAQACEEARRHIEELSKQKDN